MAGSGWVETQAAHHLQPVEPHLYNAQAVHHPNTLNVIHHYPQPLPQTLPLPYSSSSYYYAYTNPNHNPAPSQEAYVSAAAGAAEPYVTNLYAPHGGYENLGAVGYSHPPPAAVEGGIGLTCNHDVGGGDVHSRAAKEAIRQYGVEPFAYAPFQWIYNRNACCL